MDQIIKVGFGLKDSRDHTARARLSQASNVPCTIDRGLLAIRALFFSGALTTSCERWADLLPSLAWKG